jgi:hypothetical protein
MRVIPSQLETAAPVPPQNHELREVRRAGRSITRGRKTSATCERRARYEHEIFRAMIFASSRDFFFRVVRGCVLVILRERREQEDLLLDRNEKSRSSRRNAPEDDSVAQTL